MTAPRGKLVHLPTDYGWVERKFPSARGGARPRHRLRRPSGDEPVREYIAALPTRERDNWEEVLTLLALFGLDAQVSLRQLDGKLWEIRVGRHRVAYVIVRGPEMVVLHAFKKQGQRTARSDLDLATRRAREVLGGFR